MTIVEKLRRNELLMKEEERQLLLDVSDFLNPVWQLDVLLSAITGKPERPNDLKNAVERLTQVRDYWLKRAKKKALKTGKVYEPPLYMEAS